MIVRIVGSDQDIEISGVNSSIGGIDILSCFELEKYRKYLLSKSVLSDICIQ